MINCFTFTKEIKAYTINDKNEMDDIFTIEDYSAKNLVHAANARDIKKIILWGQKAFCNRLLEEMISMDSSLQIEIK